MAKLTSPRNILVTTLSTLLISIIPNAYPTNTVITTPHNITPTCTQGPQKSSKIEFYAHNIYSGPNQSLYIVANSSISNTSPSQFGRILVADVKLTQGPDYNSRQVGRAQGIAVSDDLTELVFGSYLIIYFNDEDDEYFAGSMIIILGRFEQARERRELSVVGGTEIFRCAHGYVVATTYFTDLATTDVFDIKIYVDYVCGV